MPRLQEIKKRAKKATAGLEYARYEHGGGRAFYNDVTLVLDCYDEDNREFYFKAREDVPWLVERLERFEEILLRFVKIDNACGSDADINYHVSPVGELSAMDEARAFLKEQ